MTIPKKNHELKTIMKKLQIQRNENHNEKIDTKIKNNGIYVTRNIQLSI